MGQDDYFLAAELTRRHPLKAYDAVQLAVAIREANVLDLIGRRLVFVSSDKTLLSAARVEGFSTENPFDYVS